MVANENQGVGMTNHWLSCIDTSIREANATRERESKALLQKLDLLIEAIKQRSGKQQET
jgi:hypothetical protein